MRMTSLICGLLAMTALLGCKVQQIHPDLRNRSLDKVALVSFYGPEDLTSYVGTLSLLQARNDWGQVLAEDVIDHVHAQLGRVVRGQLLSLEEAQKGDGYDRLPLDDSYLGKPTNAKGLRAISLEDEHDARLGAYAASLGVDAVFVFKNDWDIRENSYTSAQVGFNALEVLVVGNDGTRLWYDQNHTEARNSNLDPTQLAREIVGGFSKVSSIAMARGAVLSGIDQFCLAWRKHRPR